MDYIKYTDLLAILDGMPDPVSYGFVRITSSIPLPEFKFDDTLESVLKNEEGLVSAREIYETYGFEGGDYAGLTFRFMKWFDKGKVIDLYSNGSLLIKERVPEKEFDKMYESSKKDAIIRNDVLFTSEKVYNNFKIDEFNEKSIISFFENDISLSDKFADLVKKAPNYGFKVFKVIVPESN